MILYTSIFIAIIIIIIYYVMYNINALQYIYFEGLAIYIGLGLFEN